MSTDVEPYQSPSSQVAAQRFEDYRALSALAMASLLFGLLSGVTFLSPYLAVVPLLGLGLGIWALIRVASRSDELTGRGLAWIGIGLSLFSLVGGVASAAYIYATEVREGYTRIGYSELQPEEGVPGQLTPPRVDQLNGQKVFIKGYMYPGSKTTGINQFLLVRDQGDCCFGVKPKITDRIQVTLKNPLRVNFHRGVFKLHGTFTVLASNQAVDAGGAVFYHLDADYVD